MTRFGPWLVERGSLVSYGRLAWGHYETPGFHLPSRGASPFGDPGLGASSVTEATCGHRVAFGTRSQSERAWRESTLQPPPGLGAGRQPGGARCDRAGSQELGGHWDASLGRRAQRCRGDAHATPAAPPPRVPGAAGSAVTTSGLLREAQRPVTSHFL